MDGAPELSRVWERDAREISYQNYLWFYYFHYNIIWYEMSTLLWLSSAVTVEFKIEILSSLGSIIQMCGSGPNEE